jgi:hypothetical protein
MVRAEIGYVSSCPKQNIGNLENYFSRNYMNYCDYLKDIKELAPLLTGKITQKVMHDILNKIRLLIESGNSDATNLYKKIVADYESTKTSTVKVTMMLGSVNYSAPI